MKILKEVTSESGKYKLIVSSIETKPGCWNVTRGEVYNSSNTLIQTIDLNYSAFPCLFIENHKNGHDYLICGEDYQGQTIVELDTGKKHSQLSEGAEKGHGFCWSSYEYNVENQVLLVNGCHWACPYEYRLYDFSDPMNFQEIKYSECIDGDYEENKPIFNPDGTITTNEYRTLDEYDEDLDDYKKELIRTYTLKRDGLTLHLINDWVSDAEKQRKIEYAKLKAEYDATVAEFKKSDPLYLKHLELCKNVKLNPSTYCYMGYNHDVKEDTYGRTILSNSTYSVELNWGFYVGEIELKITKNQKRQDTIKFPHSVEGMEQAFDYILKL